MDTPNVVPPENGHAPESLRPNWSKRARVTITAFSVVALITGSGGGLLYGHWLFWVVAATGGLGLWLLEPYWPPVLWSRPRS